MMCTSVRGQKHEILTFCVTGLDGLPNGEAGGRTAVKAVLGGLTDGIGILDGLRLAQIPALQAIFEESPGASHISIPSGLLKFWVSSMETTLEGLRSLGNGA